MIAFIVARAENDVIGSRNDLPWYLPDDLKRFKELTTGHTVVMGRKTFDSIVSRLGHPLPNRVNIVVTRQEDFQYDGVTTLHDVDEIAKLSGDVYVIGGAELYRATFHMADTLYITEVLAEISGDTYFPVVKPSEWREVAREHHDKDEQHFAAFDFVQYERIHETH